MSKFYKVGCWLFAAAATIGASAWAGAANSGSDLLLPDGYVRLRYVISDGNQYIDTGRKLYAPSDVVHMKFKCTWANDAGVLFGNRIDSTHQAFAAHYFDTTFNFAINVNNSAYEGNRFWFYDYRKIVNFYNKPMDIVASVSGAMVTVGDVVCGPQLFTNKDTFETAGTCTILKTVPVPGQPASGLPDTAVTGELSAFTIVSNNVTVLDLIPVKRTVGGGEEVGMYDTVSGAFFGSVGTAPFIAGPQVEPTAEIAIDSIEGRTVNVSFPAVETARELYVCYGLADGGAVVADWDHSKKVADVAAGATSARAILPVGFGETYSVARIVLLGTPDSYAGDLVARYDGIDNVREGGVIGHQDGTGVTWANLAGERGIALDNSVADADGVVYDSVYDKDKKNGQAFSTESYAADAIKTIEVVARIDGVLPGQDGAIWSGANAKAPVPQARVHDNGQTVTCFGNTGLSGTQSIMVDPYFTVDKGQTFSIAYVRRDQGWETYVNGFSTRCFIDWTPTAGAIEFGNLSTAGRGTKGKIYSIRLHSSPLTDRQVEENYVRDYNRFAALAESWPLAKKTWVSPALGAPADRVWVTETTRDDESKLSAVVLGFPPTKMSADVYAALANADCGDLTNDWAVVTKIATVEANATSVACDLTDLPCDRYRRIRFFLKSTEPPVREYEAADSLIGWWDGVNNAVIPCVCHDATEKSWWGDLASRDPHGLNLGMATQSLLDNGMLFLHSSATRYVSTRASYEANDIQTIEATFRIYSSGTGDGVLWCGYTSVDESPVPQCRVGRKNAAPADFELGWSSANGVIGNPFHKGHWGDLITVTYVRNGSKFEAYVNGAATGVSQTFTPKSARMCFAGFSGAARGIDALYHSIRMYSKALTPAEIASNYAVDKNWLVDREFISSRILSTRQPGFMLIIR